MGCKLPTFSVSPQYLSVETRPTDDVDCDLVSEHKRERGRGKEGEKERERGRGRERE